MEQKRKRTPLRVWKGTGYVPKAKPRKTEILCVCGCGKFLTDSDLFYSNVYKISCRTKIGLKSTV
jgi:hypothetical protein